MNSGDLIAKYSKQLANTSPITNKNQPKVIDYNHYAPNEFKRFMEYEEPDYLKVAGLYASMETSKKSKIYGGFLVKKADYVAEKLGWLNDDGEPDVKRAETAIRTACRKKSPRGLCYMYSVPNKKHCLSDKGGSRIYMSGRRYQQIEFERLALEAKYQNTPYPADANTETEQTSSNFEKVKYLVKRAADFHNLSSYGEGAIVWVANSLLNKLDMDDIEWYLNLLASKTYIRHIQTNRNCPRITGIFDIFGKFDKIVDYAEKHQ